MGKRISVKNIVQKRYSLVDGLSKEIKDSLGEIEDTFTAIIYGESGQGKTNLTVQLLKELHPLGSMLYISYEEGHGKSIQDLINRHNLDDELPNLQFSDGETIQELVAYLKKKQSPKVVVLDSWQYSEFTFEDYKELKRQFVFGKTGGRRKIFFFISHVKGSIPDGKSAIEVKRDCNIKIHVNHFVGFITSRISGSIKNYCIYDKGAKAHWGKDLDNIINKLPLGKKVTKKKVKTVKKEVIETYTNLQLFGEETEEDKTARMLKNLKESI